MSGGRQAAMSHHYFPFVPPHLTLPGKTSFLIMVYFWPSQCDFKKFSRVTQKIKTQTIFSILLKINILCVEFLNCFAMKFLTNLTELHLEISQSLMIIQLLTHYTKSILKSLINQLVTHGCRKRKKLICGTEGEIVVAHGRLPSPAHRNRCLINVQACGQQLSSLLYDKKIKMLKYIATPLGIWVSFYLNELKAWYRRNFKLPSIGRVACPFYNSSLWLGMSIFSFRVEIWHSVRKIIDFKIVYFKHFFSHIPNFDTDPGHIGKKWPKNERPFLGMEIIIF